MLFCCKQSFVAVSADEASAGLETGVGHDSLRKFLGCHLETEAFCFGKDHLLSDQEFKNLPVETKGLQNFR